MTPARIPVAIVFGGRSSEHEISCLSAGNVLAALDRDKYLPVPIGITREGAWHLQPDDPSFFRKVDDTLPAVLPHGDAAVLSMDPERRGFWLHPESGVPQWQEIDVVFPLLHGPNGEDGSIQGMLELAGIPFVGCGVFSSAACMDKGHTKTILGAAGLPVGSWHPVHARHWDADPDGVTAAVRGLGWPVFVKPARAGSSMGVAKVHQDVGLAPAIEHAVTHDPRVVVEGAVANAREIECGVLGHPDGTIAASVCGEIKVHDSHEFYDYEAKYLADAVDLVVPAALTDVEAKELRGLAVRAFEAMNCEGLARVDFFLTDSSEVIINEVNTMPGFTAGSMYPRMWQASGLGYAELLDVLLQEAMARVPGMR
ncbi:MAG: D-alanine--D-alanine ligase [Actinomycetia bacterium]|nr:D-alanine--D-alanine ligase [Actinomycetes bacterium]